MEDRPQRRGILSEPSKAAPAPDAHPFVRHPHRTLLALTLPVLGSLIAEPLTGLVDTAFVKQLGAAPLTALAVSTQLLSSIFWIFNFLNIGTQTGVARASGAGSEREAGQVLGTALALSGALGVGLALLAWPLLGAGARFMSADPAVQEAAVAYLEVRLLGGPAVLLMAAAFGALRGLQRMSAPLWIALGANALNAALDPLLIFGLGPFPALGVAGAAWASTLAQWLAAALAVGAAARRLPIQWSLRGATALLVVGRDLTVRTGLLTLFLLLTTRAAARAGTDPGAAHQAIRSVWLLSAFVLDAWAHSAQSLVGYFLGAGRVATARRVASLACAWGAGTGLAIALAMWLGQAFVLWLLVPASAAAGFAVPWLLAAVFQPLNAVSFVTDGIHWGSGDYAWLRNGMLAATGTGLLLLFAATPPPQSALTWIWIATGAWITVRSGFGLLRIWPGLGTSPLSVGDVPPDSRFS